MLEAKRLDIRVSAQASAAEGRQRRIAGTLAMLILRRPILDLFSLVGLTFGYLLCALGCFAVCWRGCKAGQFEDVLPVAPHSR